jgi:hypothetical protein
MTEPVGHVKPRTISDTEQPGGIDPSTASSGGNLFDLYQKVVETRPGTRDAEIFEKIREWTFSNFSQSAHEFAGITKAELDSWQMRNRINLSAGQIRPDPIDLERGFAWGQIRLASAANRLHAKDGPPSAQEIKLARFSSGSIIQQSQPELNHHSTSMGNQTNVTITPKT